MSVQHTHHPPQSNDTELIPQSDPRAALISIDPERMHGTACFRGTRVPIRTLFEYLAEGDSLEVFLDAFEGVSREQAVTVLRLASEHLLHELPRR